VTLLLFSINIGMLILASGGRSPFPLVQAHRKGTSPGNIGCSFLVAGTDHQKTPINTDRLSFGAKSLPAILFKISYYPIAGAFLSGGSVAGSV
jgi:hypothetical protein